MAMDNTRNLSLNGALWVRDEVDKGLVSQLQSAGIVDEILSTCLIKRGICELKEAREFLSPKLSQLHDPFLMKDMQRAVSRLELAIRNQELIRVVTDYDVDGTTSSLILQSVLEILGHRNFTYHIPHRMSEGYGFSLLAAEKAFEDGVKLIVTADIGVRDFEAIDFSQKHGIDVIVLDHHLPQGSGIPENAYAVLCPPQKACNYPNKALAACGISLKFAQAMLHNRPNYETILRSMLKLAAMGTIADVVTLMDQENRAIVALGLQELNAGKHKAGLKALLDVSDLKNTKITPEEVGYKIAPRINAAGRLSSATEVIELLRCASNSEATKLAQYLDSLNTERQELQELMLQRVLDSLPEKLPDFLFVAFEESEIWHRGIVGIVAGRVRERINRPVALASIAGNTVIGSVRSIPSIHALRALERASHLLLRFGGHAAAAGFSLPLEETDAFAQLLNKSAIEQSGGEIGPPTLPISFELELDSYDNNIIDSIDLLQPYGKDNPEPYLCFRNVNIKNVALIKDKHLRGDCLNDKKLAWIWFNAAEHKDLIAEKKVDILCRLRKNEWRSVVYNQLMVEDMRLAEEK